MGASRAVETKQCRLQGTALPRRAHAPMRAVRQAATSSFAGAGKNSRATARADSLVLRAAAEEVNSTKVAAVSVGELPNQIHTRQEPNALKPQGNLPWYDEEGHGNVFPSMSPL